MKKIFTTILALSFGASMAQSPSTMSEAAPVTNLNPTVTSVNALFDVLFSYPLDTITSANGNAGIAFINNEFWISRWASDSLFTLDTAGVLISRFVVPTVTGVRSLTTDGTSLYAGINTNSIKKINPITKALISSISCASTGINARSLSYDATANGGAGGLWVSNFNTDIYLIDLSGNILSTIPAGNHGLTGMYGTTVDNVTPGGPYLWVFDQSYSAGQSDIVQLEVASGAATGVSFDVLTNVSIPLGGATGLAGGIFLSPTLNPTGALVALLQGTPSNMLVGLDLNNVVGINEMGSENDVFMTLHPNPASSNVTIEFENYSKGNYALEIADITGKVVFENAQVMDEYSTVDISTFEPGIYVVRAKGNHKVSTKKLIVQ